MRNHAEIKTDIDRIYTNYGDVSGAHLDRLRSMCALLGPLRRECSEHGHIWGEWERNDKLWPTMLKQCRICKIIISVHVDDFGKPFDDIKTASP